MSARAPIQRRPGRRASHSGAADVGPADPAGQPPQPGTRRFRLFPSVRPYGANTVRSVAKTARRVADTLNWEGARSR
jgi:hypothetical protein